MLVTFNKYLVIKVRLREESSLYKRGFFWLNISTPRASPSPLSKVSPAWASHHLLLAHKT